MRVFVLGAGASLHAGYPLAAELGNCLAEWIGTLPPDHEHRHSLQQIADAYGRMDNFEDILSDLMTCPEGSRAAALGSKRPYLTNALQEAIRDYFDAVREAPAPLYDRLTRILQPGDRLITFNYDLGVERALHKAGLWHIKTGYGFPIGEGERSPVEVLKLHGSTNWRALLFGGRTRVGSFMASADSLGDRPVLFFKADLEYLGYPDFVDPLCSRLNTAASQPAMIMPALPKEFYYATTFGQEWKDFWDDLWDNRVASAIANADELVIIGYSLPLTDERARKLLLSTRNRCVRLSICCGPATPDLEQLFRNHGFSRIDPTAHTFEDFLARETQRTAAASISDNSIVERLNGLVG